MHPCPGNWIAIGRAVMYTAETAQAFSAGIKRRHCMLKKTGQNKNMHRVIPRQVVQRSAGHHFRF